LELGVIEQLTGLRGEPIRQQAECQTARTVNPIVFLYLQLGADDTPATFRCINTGDENDEIARRCANY
jgi:hypothetical protein